MAETPEQVADRVVEDWFADEAYDDELKARIAKAIRSAERSAIERAAQAARDVARDWEACDAAFVANGADYAANAILALLPSPEPGRG